MDARQSLASGQPAQAGLVNVAQAFGPRATRAVALKRSATHTKALPQPKSKTLTDTLCDIDMMSEGKKGWRVYTAYSMRQNKPTSLSYVSSALGLGLFHLAAELEAQRRKQPFGEVVLAARAEARKQGRA